MGKCVILLQAATALSKVLSWSSARLRVGGESDPEDFGLVLEPKWPQDECIYKTGYHQHQQSLVV